MVEKILFPVLISFGIATILGPIVIPFLRRLKVGQTEREELESHQIKTGTPTMGGLIILAAIVITSLFYVSRLSQDHTDRISYGRFWRYRISG